MLTLYHAPRSRSSRILWLLEELGEPYEVEYMEIRRGDGTGGLDPRNPHPHKKVPALVHDGVLISETAAICLYLSDAFPAAGLGPQVDDPKRADYLHWLFYYPGVIEPALTAKATGWSGPPAMVGWDTFEAVEARISDRLQQGPWMLGERFSTIDILIGSLLQWAARMFPDRPEYEAFKARINERPALSRALTRDEKPGVTTPINLNKARKARAKVEAKLEAAQNRARFGRTKAEKAAETARVEKVRSILDGAKRER